MDNKYVFKIINTLIDELPNEVKNSENPIEIDLVLDGGVFNGSYLIGAVYFLKEMEKRNFIKIKRISGCSIGSLIGFLYLIDKLDIVTELYKVFITNFKKNYNFENLKNLQKYLFEKIPHNTDICSLINNKLFIKYNNIQTGVQIVKCKYKNINDIMRTIIRSGFFPYLIDGNLAHENKYVDGFNPYFFKQKPNRKILFLDLSGADKFTYILNIKNEKTNLYRILSGILDIHIFLTKKTETFMCSYVNEWGYLNKSRYFIRFFLEKIICFISYFIVLIKKYIDYHLIDTITYKIITNLVYDTLIIFIKKYCI
jgi:hypothetical protein